jgi:hypothetical protein
MKEFKKNDVVPVGGHLTHSVSPGYIHGPWDTLRGKQVKLCRVLIKL